MFNQFVEALQWILSHNYNICLIHYLDDYFLVGPPDAQNCAAAVHTTLTVCTALGIPVALDKLEGPATKVTYLGIELDSCSWEL